MDGHGGLRLGEDCRDVLRGERRVELHRDTLREKRPRKARKSAATIDISPAGQALFDLLRAKRLALAKAQGVPPYVIFHDSTLVAMATTNPRNLESLALIPGVGESKLRRYGAEFLETIAAFQSAG
jgi:ATP-dependent DNA helicase RecQ